MALMGTALQPSQADGAGFGRKLGRGVMIGLAAAVVVAPWPSQAAIVRPRPPAPSPTPSPSPTPEPAPVPYTTDINSSVSAGSAAIDLGSNFLRRLGNQA